MKLSPSFLPLAVAISVLIAACQPVEGKEVGVPKPDSGPTQNNQLPDSNAEPVGETFNAFSDLKPDELPPKEANLILSGTKVEVELNPIVKDGAVILTWLAHGVEVEREKYAVSPQALSLVSGPAESYEPAVPLLMFPFKVGDSYSYKGSQTIGRVSRPATAKISTAEETLNLETGNFGTIRVTVNMHVETGTPGGTDSEFKFWFKPGGGMVRREFGFSSTREPRKAPETSDAVTTIKE